MYNLLEYSDNYSMISRSLWNYFRDEINDDENEHNNNNNNNRLNNNEVITSKDFEYNAKLVGSTQNNNSILGADVDVPLKHLSNFRRSLDLPFIKCEIELDLKWKRYCLITATPITFRPDVWIGKDKN